VCWFLFPFFLASCFYALWVSSVSLHKRKDVSHTRLVCVKFLSFSIRALFTWSFLAALILIVPCLFVLLTFHSVMAACGAIFLLGYTALSVFILLIVLLGSGIIVVDPLLRLVGWGGIFVAWWWFVDSYFFIGVGVPCGYGIANPVLCCAVSPLNCALVAGTGVYGLLALSVLAAGGGVLWWVSRSRRCGILALVAVGILGLSALTVVVLHSSKATRLSFPWKSICAFKLTEDTTGVLERVTELHRQFLACSSQTVVPDLIVGPESCVPCALNNEPSLYTLFDNPGSCVSPQVLLGARRQEETVFTVIQSSSAMQDFSTQNASIREHNVLGKNKKCFNSAFIVHQGRIIYHYDKQFPLPFLETRASVCLLSFLHGLFFSKQKVSRANEHLLPAGAEHSLFLSEEKIPYSAGTGTGEVALSLGGVVYNVRLALCSDFFCTNNFYTKNFGISWHALKPWRATRSLSELFAPEKSSLEKSFLEKSSLKNNPLLIVLTHDSWFYGTSVADRMHRYAVLWAVDHQIPVLYVGNLHASWIEPSGYVWSLATIDS